MSSYTRGKKRFNLVFVLVNDFMYFGFKPKDLTSFPGISTSDITALGHVAASALLKGKIRVIGAQAPKPPKMTKRISGATVGQQQTVSTYCGYPSITTAQGAGWNLIKGRSGVSLRASSSFRGSLTAIATLSDFSLYCFPMNKADFETYGVELGLKRSTNITNNVERGKLVSGSSTPYPGKASKLLANGSSFSSFFSTAKQGDIAQAGYDIVSEERVLSTGEPPF